MTVFPSPAPARDDGREMHRGGPVMSFGIISLVLVFLSGGACRRLGAAIAGIGGVAGLPNYDVAWSSASRLN